MAHEPADAELQAARDEAIRIAHVVVEALPARVALDTAWLYGSGATGRLRKDSDLDIGLLLQGSVSAWELAKLAAEFEPLAGRPLQLVDLDAAGPILARQVLAKGVLVLDAKPARRHHFLMRTMTAYADLKHARAPVEAALRARLRREG
jgi:predicted nucleotidyltransferase